MSLAVIVLMGAAATVTPPMQNDWATAEVVIGGDGLTDKQRCGVEHAEVLVVLAQQTATDGMSRDERRDYDALVERFVSEGLPMPDPDLSWKALLKKIR